MARHNLQELSLIDAVNEFKPGVLTHIKSGIASLLSLDKKYIPDVISCCRDILKSSLNPDEDEFAEKIGLSKQEAINILSTASFLYYILSSGKYTGDLFIKELNEVQLLPEDRNQDIRIFIETIIHELPVVKEEMDQFAIASEILPSLQSFSIAVDLRLKFISDSISSATPVAIAQVDTDGEGQVVWFQMNALQVERLILDLQKTLGKMRIADREFKNLTSKTD
jgi:hypothetical protein